MRNRRIEIDVVDENGERHTLSGSQRINTFPTMSDGDLREPGLAELFTADGERVNAERDGSYTAIRTGRRFFAA